MAHVARGDPTLVDIVLWPPLARAPLKRSANETVPPQVRPCVLEYVCELIVRFVRAPWDSSSVSP